MMYNYSSYTNILPRFMFLIYFLVVVDALLKIVALWKSARNGQKVWFVFLILVNSLGILPLIYLVLENGKSAPVKKVVIKKRIAKRK